MTDDSRLRSVGAIRYDFVAGQTTPRTTPLGRREHIRDSLEQGDWQAAARHLHEAKTTQEWRMVAGISSWSAYVQTIPVSRMHDWRLRLIARSGYAQVGYTYRAALRAARVTPLSRELDEV